MKQKVLIITQDEFSLGFELSQVKGCAVKNSEEAKKKLEEIMNSKEYGVVLLDEELTKGFDLKFKKKVFASDSPMIMSLPLKREFREKPMEDEFLDFIRSAIGFKIRV
ncbi:MAG: V-type ATP synthase subunit F [Candidatus Omnitrophica bacterium]|nr:V-type ATP synthase subunit F [Candidatus Omnitrophota bacterium]